MADIAQSRTPSKMPKTSKSSKVTNSISGSPKNLKKEGAPAVQSPEASNLGDDYESVLPESEDGEYEEQTIGGHTNGHTDAHAETAEEEEEGEEDEGTEAIPAGSVDKEGNVVDEEGKVLGHVTGEHKSLEASIVDKKEMF